MAEKCTNTSSPFSRAKNPKPLAALNHFTVPVSFILFSFLAMEVRTAIEVNYDLRAQVRGSVFEVSSEYWNSKATRAYHIYGRDASKICRRGLLGRCNHWR